MQWWEGQGVQSTDYGVQRAEQKVGLTVPVGRRYGVRHAIAMRGEAIGNSWPAGQGACGQG